MPRPTPLVVCSDSDRREVERLSASRSEEARVVERAKIILGCLDGKHLKQIAHELGVGANTVIEWREHFLSQGVLGLKDWPRAGRPVRFGPEFREKVPALLETAPPTGKASCDGPAVAHALEVSEYAVWRLLRKEGIHLRLATLGSIGCPTTRLRRSNTMNPSLS